LRLNGFQSLDFVLSESYEQFKKSLHHLFGNIYDTKCLAWGIHLLRQQQDPEDRSISDTNLFALYSNLSTLLQPVLKPLIEPENETFVYKDALYLGQARNLETISEASCHSAAFDAVVTGAVFLKLGYIACRPEISPEYMQGLHPTATEIFKRVSTWKDEVNLGRATIRNIHLSQTDPRSERPDWIRVMSSEAKKVVDPAEVRQYLSKYGDIEIEVVSQNELIIACGGFGCFRNSWKLLSSKGYRLKKENVNGLSLSLSNWFLGIGTLSVLLGSLWWVYSKS
jgi:hypothetical protein